MGKHWAEKEKDETEGTGHTKRLFGWLQTAARRERNERPRLPNGRGSEERQLTGNANLSRAVYSSRAGQRRNFRMSMRMRGQGRANDDDDRRRNVDVKRDMRRMSDWAGCSSVVQAGARLFRVTKGQHQRDRGKVQLPVSVHGEARFKVTRNKTDQRTEFFFTIGTQTGGRYKHGGSADGSIRAHKTTTQRLPCHVDEYTHRLAPRFWSVSADMAKEPAPASGDATRRTGRCERSASNERCRDF
jgi:hypothetical protein